MLLKALIVDRKEYKYQIRIPQLHGFSGTENSTPDYMLPYASVCLTSGIDSPYNVDDIVFVMFEDNDMDKPVIMGKLLYNK